MLCDQCRRVSRLGVTQYEGMMRLIDSLPALWKGWASEAAKPYLWHQLPEYNPEGDMDGFVKVLLCGLVDARGGPPLPRPVLMATPPPTQLERPSTSKRARVEVEDLDSSKDEDVMVDTQMIEARPLATNEGPARNELAEENEEEEDPSEDEDRAQDS